MTAGPRSKELTTFLAVSAIPDRSERDELKNPRYDADLRRVGAVIVEIKKPRQLRDEKHEGNEGSAR